MNCTNFKSVNFLKPNKPTKERQIKIYASGAYDQFNIHLEDIDTKERLYIRMNREEAMNQLNTFHVLLFGKPLIP